MSNLVGNRNRWLSDAKTQMSSFLPSEFSGALKKSLSHSQIREDLVNLGMICSDLFT